jgi:hypothetical protein
LRSVNYTVCGNQTAASETSSNGNDLNELNGFRDLFCSYNADMDFDMCYLQCGNPCVEYLYDTSVSTSGQWPDPRYQMALFSTFVDGQELYGEKFSAYKDISEMIKTGSMTPVSSFIA